MCGYSCFYFIVACPTNAGKCNFINSIYLEDQQSVIVIIDIDNLVFPLLHFTPSFYKDIFSKIRNKSYPC